ncbi:MAG: SDR family oxidoreductase [Thermoflexaceae bacterium]|nr:SDR family oxidoreductase [Thermoflexaceae bacterium]
MAQTLAERFRVDGRTALVTGAGMGIGRSIALCLAEAGADVAVQDIKLDAAEAVAAEVRALGRRAVAIGSDARQEAAVDAMLVQAQRDLGRLDILVNNAGIYPFSNILDMPVEQWDSVIELNVRTVFLATRKAGRIMAESGGGSIINLASVQGFRPGAPGIAHYDTSKAAVIMLTKAAALEFAPMGIRVNAIAPGVIATPGTEMILQASGAQMRAHTPIGRLGTPQDIGDVAVFLASPAASFITGETVVVDGGYLLI